MPSQRSNHTENPDGTTRFSSFSVPAVLRDGRHDPIQSISRGRLLSCPLGLPAVAPPTRGSVPCCSSAAALGTPIPGAALASRGGV